MMQQQLEETNADQKKDITSLKQRLVMGQDAYQGMFLDRHQLLAKLIKLKSRILDHSCYFCWQSFRCSLHETSMNFTLLSRGLCDDDHWVIV